MSYKRYTIDLAFPEPISPALSGLLVAMEAAIKKAKPLASKINAGQPNEEMTVKAVWHKCYHDEGRSCEAENEI